MRITNKLLYVPFQSNLEEIQNRRNEEQIRLSTGKRIISVSDDPYGLAKVKQLTDLIERNKQHLISYDEAISEMTILNDNLENISGKFQEIRQIAIESTLTGSSRNLVSLGMNVKALLEDIVNAANAEYKGKYLLSGTKTTSDSLEILPEAKNLLPYEIITDTPTAENPSGLKVIFKGNNNERVILKDTQTNEIIGTKPEEVFGNGSTEVFDAIINLYNILTFNGSGTKRTADDYYTQDELKKLDEYQKRIAEIYDTTNSVTAQNGSRINRLQAIRDQLQYENTNLSEIRSASEDTDVVDSIIKLKEADTALEYTLQTGSSLISKTLFDFLG